MAFNTPSSIDHLFTPELIEESRLYGEPFPYNDEDMLLGVSTFLSEPSGDPMPIIPGMHLKQVYLQPQHQHEGPATPDSIPRGNIWPNVLPSVEYGTVFGPGVNVSPHFPPAFNQYEGNGLVTPDSIPEGSNWPNVFPRAGFDLAYDPGLNVGPFTPLNFDNVLPNVGFDPTFGAFDPELGLDPLFPPAVHFPSNTAIYPTPPFVTPPPQQQQQQQSPASPPKPKRGRPRTRPSPDPNAPKRGPGRPSNKKDSYTRISRGLKKGMTRAEHKAEVAKRKAEAANNSR